MKALCAVDGSQFSQWSVEALRALTDHRPEQVGLLHVIDTERVKPETGSRSPGVRHMLATAEKEADRLLRRLAGVAELALSQSVVNPRTRLRLVIARGAVAPTIVRQATRERADLLVIGTRGLSDARGFLLGSVARKVVSLASRPVLVVKRPLHELKRVVVATDGSAHSEAACRFLRDKLLPQTAHVTVLTVAHPVVNDLVASVLPLAQLTRLSKPVEARAQRVAAGWRDRFLREGFEVSTEVMSGHPALSILHVLERTHADLVVLGSRGLTGDERLVLGSVSESVLQQAPCAVLVVRSGRA